MFGEGFPPQSPQPPHGRPPAQNPFPPGGQYAPQGGQYASQGNQYPPQAGQYAPGQYRPAWGATSTVRIVHVFPHLLGTYGDAGNAIVLRQRLAERGMRCELTAVHPGEPVPDSGDIYVIGGGEDAKQTAAAEELIASGTLVQAARRGAVVLGICAGFQLLGRTFLGVGGRPAQGLGLLDVRTDRLERRAVGNVLAESNGQDRLPDLIGFENHGGATLLGPAARPLGIVSVGIGNGDGQGTEGAVQGNVYGTYLHGPVLAANPALADHLIGLVTGPLPPLDDSLCERMRRYRREVVLPQAQRASRRRGLMAGLRGRDDRPSGAAANLGTTAGR